MHQQLLGFHAQENIFSYVKVGGLCWPCKDIDLRDTEVKFCTY